MAIALALPESGKLVACDISKEYTDIGKPFWVEVSQRKISLHDFFGNKTMYTYLSHGIYNIELYIC